jgi:hypothetical protein
LDGQRRVRALQELQGGPEVDCVVTNDFPRMLMSLGAAKAADPNFGLRKVYDHYIRFNEIGTQWAYAARSQVQRGAPKGRWPKDAATTLGGPLGVRARFVGALGVVEWHLNEYMDMMAVYRRTHAKSPEHAAALEEIRATVDAGLIGVAGARTMANMVEGLRPHEIAVPMQNWRNRVKNRGSRVERRRQQIRERAEAASFGRDVSPLNDTISQMEGIMYGLKDLKIPGDMDPKVRSGLVKRIVKARTEMGRFITELKGNEGS